MSKWNCVLCDHDTEGEGGNPWLGAEGDRVCKVCCEKLCKQFFALLLPNSGPEWDEYGATVNWHQIAQILEGSTGKKYRDVAMRVTEYIFTLTDLARRKAEVPSRYD